MTVTTHPARLRARRGFYVWAGAIWRLSVSGSLAEHRVDGPRCANAQKPTFTRALPNRRSRPTGDLSPWRPELLFMAYTGRSPVLKERLR